MDNLEAKPMSAQSRIEGLISDTAGQPQAGVAVNVGAGQQQLTTVLTDTSGRYQVSNLAAGSYWVITGDGRAAVAGIRLDGANTRIVNLTVPAADGYRYVVITKRLLSREETGNQRRFYGRVFDEGGGGLNGVTLEMSWANAGGGTQFPRITTPRDPFREPGNFEFLHSAGTFALQVVQGDWPSDVADGLQTVDVPGREGDPITYEVNFQLRPSEAVVGTGSLAGVITNGAGLGLTLWQGDPEQVGQPGYRSWALVLPANGVYSFTALPGGPFSLVLEGEGVVHAFALAEGAGATFNYVVGTPPLPPPPPPPSPDKPMAHYWLLGRSEQGAALLSLLLPYWRSHSLTSGARLDEAFHAQSVTIIGGEEVASAADEQALLDAGCQVQRLPSDAFELAALLQL